MAFFILYNTPWVATHIGASGGCDGRSTTITDPSAVTFATFITLVVPYDKNKRSYPVDTGEG